ncbi:MAG: phosphatase PAP2 family protein [bacterium]|nr:phosphatase PAP2 family protein [bacterium]
MWSLMRRAYAQTTIPKRVVFACVIGFIFCLLAPVNLQSYGHPSNNEVVVFNDSYLRFTNTAVQIAIPVLLADKIGMMQLVYVGISTTVATQGLKRILDKWEIWGTQLGERPKGPTKRHNMPSGHSSMAACAVYFVCRRYGFVHALYLTPIMLLTMYSRVALNDHTVTAVIAGALIGFLMAAIFTSKRIA